MRPDAHIPSIDGLAVRRELGHGGMGVVYLATDARGRTCALKVVAASDPAPDARARFAREIDAVARIQHRNVVKLFGSGHAQGAPYALFERVRGCDLASLAAQPWPVVVYLGRQLAHGLDAVHRAGYVHRDVKPSNVMVSRRCKVTLIDFGLVKPVGQASIDGAASRPTRGDLTEPGAIAGTPRFLAPELRRGAPASVQSDLFAFGLVLRHLLGGSRGAAACAPRALTDLIDACLAEDPAHRPASAAEVACVLDGLEGRPARLIRTAAVRSMATGTTRSVALASTVLDAPAISARRRHAA
jgi:serine/threonine protein kinase